jgi:hypothetical protein
MGVRETFSDPSPYQTYINRWMLAAEDQNQNELGAPSVQPVTLAQAQAVKTALINSLFDLKRQAPIAVTFQAEGAEEFTTTTYDAGDENVSNMQSQAIGELTGSSGSGQGGLGTAIATLQASINAAFSTHDAYVSYYNSQVIAQNNDITSFNNSLDSTMTTINSNTNFMNSGYVATINGTLGGCTVTSALSGSDWASGSVGSTFNAASMPNTGMSNVGYQHAPAAPYLSTSLGSVSAGAIPGGTGPTATQNALAAIKNRRNTLKTTQTTKTGQVAALTSVAAVAAYDITAGW